MHQVYKHSFGTMNELNISLYSVPGSVSNFPYQFQLAITKRVFLIYDTLMCFFYSYPKCLSGEFGHSNRWIKETGDLPFVSTT